MEGGPVMRVPPRPILSWINSYLTPYRGRKEGWKASWLVSVIGPMLIAHYR